MNDWFGPSQLPHRIQVIHQLYYFVFTNGRNIAGQWYILMLYELLILQRKITTSLVQPVNNTFSITKNNCINRLLYPIIIVDWYCVFEIFGCRSLIVV